MTPFQWSGQEPEKLNDVEVAEELGAKWQGDELLVSDYDGFSSLPEYYDEDAEFLPDTD